MKREELMRKCFVFSEEIAAVFLRGYKFEGVSHSEFMMLHMLMERFDEKSNMTVTVISECVGISKAAVSQMIKQLENKEWIKRLTDTRDKRLAYVCLTDKGRAAYKEQLGRIGQSVSAAFEDISDEEIGKLAGSLEVIASKIRRG